MDFDPDQFLASIQVSHSAPVASEMSESGAHCHHAGPQLFLYRARASVYENAVDFYFDRYRVVRFTTCGAWITLFEDSYLDPILHWVSLSPLSGKRLAHVSKDLALHSLRRRNERHLAILQWQLRSAKTVYAALNPPVPT